jgi:hypothetical protein
MKKYKVYYENDPQEETIFCVEGENLKDATLKACEIKSLSSIDFHKIFGIKETKYESYV